MLVYDRKEFVRSFLEWRPGKGPAAAVIRSCDRIGCAVRTRVPGGKVGIFAEPAGAASYAGLTKAVLEGVIKPDDPILVLNTGNGLKDISTAMQAVLQAPIIGPTLEAVENIISCTY